MRFIEIFSDSMQGTLGFYAYTSETLCYKMDRQLEVIPWRIRVS